MELLQSLLDLFLHLDKHLTAFTAEYGVWVYALLALVVFCETGLVVTPFLPGDSLLFVAGAVAAKGGMDVLALMVLSVGIATYSFAQNRQLTNPLRKNGVPGAMASPMLSMSRLSRFFM